MTGPSPRLPAVPARLVRRVRGSQLATRVLRPARKRLKRAGSVLRSGHLWAVNRFSRRPVTADTPVVVSLTTHGTRINTVALAIESIAAGTVRPGRLILWLDHDGVLPHGRLPAAVVRLQRRGLEVLVAQNAGPHGKYYGYVAGEAEHTVPLVTADDDILYPRRWLADLFAAHQGAPTQVHCHWAKAVTVHDGAITPYASWPVVASTAPAGHHFALGVSGVIYPPALLTELARQGRAFDALCPHADDIWLHWVALQTQTPIRQITAVAHHFPVIAGTQETGLLQANVAGGGNDASIRALYTEGDIATLSPTVDRVTQP